MIIFRFLFHRNVVCEQPTDLTGDLFVGDFDITFPDDCTSDDCQSAFNTIVVNGLRDDYQPVQIDMIYTDGTSETVELIFCAILDPSKLTNNINYLSGHWIHLISSLNMYIYIFRTFP